MKYVMKQLSFWLALLNFCGAAMQLGLGLHSNFILHTFIGSVSFSVGIMCWRRIKWQKIHYILA